MSKKWAFPALYVAAAAIILTLVWVYQGSNLQPLQTSGTKTQVETTQGTDAAAGTQEDVKAVVSNNETLGWPVEDVQGVDVVMGFFDAAASKEDQQRAVVEYKQTFTPNSGIDLARKDQKPFEVLAAMSGTVTRAEQHPMMGNVVEIDHGNGMKTVYQSVAELKVKKGDAVKKGAAIASAGRSEMEKDLGVHVHFEVFEGTTPVNPSSLLAKN